MSEVMNVGVMNVGQSDNSRKRSHSCGLLHLASKRKEEDKGEGEGEA